MVNIKFLTTLLFFVLLSTSQVFASPLIDTMTVQGYMKLANGTAVPNGAYTLAFGVRQNGVTLWCQQNLVTVTNGLFSQNMTGLGSDCSTLPAGTALNANYSAVTLNPALLQAGAAGEVSVRIYAVSAISGNNPQFDIQFNAVPSAYYSAIAKAVDSGAVTFAGIAAGAYSSTGGASGLSGGVGKLVQYDNTGHLDSTVFNTGTPDVPVGAISGNLPSSQIAAGALPAGVTIPASQLTGNFNAITVAAGQGITASGAANIDFSGSTGFFKFPSGAVTGLPASAVPNIDASIITTGTLPGTVSVPGGDITGAASISAAVLPDLSATYAKLSGSSSITMAAAAGISTTAGAGAFDFSNATGAFKTSTGAVTIGGPTTFAANVGIATTAGTGAFDFSNGTGIFKTSTGNATIGGTGGASSTTVQAGTGGMTLSTGAATNIALTPGTTGTVTVGGTTPTVTSASTLLVQPASGSALTIGNAAGASNVTIQAGATGTMTVGNASSGNSTHGNTGGASVTTITSGTGGIKIGNTTPTAFTKGIQFCSTALTATANMTVTGCTMAAGGAGWTCQCNINNSGVTAVAPATAGIASVNPGYTGARVSTANDIGIVFTATITTAGTGFASCICYQ